MDALLMRADAYVRLGEYDQAILDDNQAIQLLPVRADAFGDRCWARAAQGKDLDIALKDCSESLRLRPSATGALDARCLAYYRLADYASALADRNAALAEDYRLQSSLYVRGLIKQKMGDIVGGNADIAAAMKIDPKIADTYADYGITP